MRYGDEYCIEVLNPSFEFDYILTTIENLSEENVSISSLCENINSFEIINNENVVTPLNEFSKIPETSVPDFNNPLKVNKIGQMPFWTEVQSKNDSVDDETAAENSDNSENYIL
uniref:Uncharacterized protein n=1 Tax=Panagrolaimus davidi TaxID=227884 RepID=A0A914QXC7_9BILA